MAPHSIVKPRVYVDTTVVSYLTAKPSRDIVTAAHHLHHMANAIARTATERTCRRAGYRPTAICTPEQLMETNQ